MRAPPPLALLLPRALLAAAASRSRPPFVGSPAATSIRALSSSSTTGSSSSSSGESNEGLQVLVTPLSGHLEGVSALTLRRPRAKNALGRQLVRELREALDTLRQEGRTTRCVVLRSSVPGVFCAGADLRERAAMTQRESAEFVLLLRRAVGELAALPMPTVAAVDGLALGGGMELALACDVRVASASAAAFAAPEARLGVIPGAGGTQRLARAVGASRAKELVFTCRRVSGSEAAAIGLVDHVVPDDDPAVAVVVAEAEGQGVEGVAGAGEGAVGAPAAEGAAAKVGGPSPSPHPAHHPDHAHHHHRGFPAYRRALDIAREIARAAPLSLRAAKAAVDQGLSVDLHSGLLLEEALYRPLLATRDRAEGLRAFAERRAPRFEGE